MRTDAAGHAIGRRLALGVLGGAVCAGAFPAWADLPTNGLPVPKRDSLLYRIRYAGTPIGRQSLRFDHSAGHLRVRSETSMKIGLGPLTAYTFSQNSLELWEAGRLAYLHAVTEEDGERFALSGIALEDGFAVTLPQGTEIYPRHIFTSNDAWAIETLESPHVLDLRDGELMRQNVRTLGSDLVEIDGEVRKTQRYAVRGRKVEAQLWYDDKLLIKADVTRERDTIEYRLQSGAWSALPSSQERERVPFEKDGNR